ncbi:MAG TPA: tetratricopeptide repeat protein [Flavobacterium sp.]|jgi:tetratricopeptide (TPR) repeat protein
MKNIVIVFLLLTEVVFAQAGFDKGNELYRKEQFAEAAEAYEGVLKTGKHSAELYFNLANSYYKMNKIAPAIYNYEKALLLNPDDADIRNNLKFAHKMMIDEVKETTPVGFSKLVRDFTSVMHYDSWAWAAVGMAAAFLLLFCGYYFTGATLYKRIFFIGMLLVLIGMATSTIAAIYAREIYDSERPAIVFAGIASVKSEPQNTGGDVTMLHEGTKVYVLEKLEDWRKVQLPDGSDGWMQQDAIKELK